MYITTGEVCLVGPALLPQAIYLTHFVQPPRLEDEPGVEWTPEMKEFIKETFVSLWHLLGPFGLILTCF